MAERVLRYLRHELQALAWIEAVLERKLASSDLALALDDGTALIDLANAIQPKLIREKKVVRSPASSAQREANLSLFAAAALTLGLQRSELFAMPLARNMQQVVRTIITLATKLVRDRAFKPGLPRIDANRGYTEADLRRAQLIVQGHGAAGSTASEAAAASAGGSDSFGSSDSRDAAAATAMSPPRAGAAAASAAKAASNSASASADRKRTKRAAKSKLKSTHATASTPAAAAAQQRSHASSTASASATSTAPRSSALLAASGPASTLDTWSSAETSTASDFPSVSLNEDVHAWKQETERMMVQLTELKAMFGVDTSAQQQQQQQQQQLSQLARAAGSPAPAAPATGAAPAATKPATATPAAATPATAAAAAAAAAAVATPAAPPLSLELTTEDDGDELWSPDDDAGRTPVASAASADAAPQLSLTTPTPGPSLAALWSALGTSSPAAQATPLANAAAVAPHTPSQNESSAVHAGKLSSGSGSMSFDSSPASVRAPVVPTASAAAVHIPHPLHGVQAMVLDLIRKLEGERDALAHFLDRHGALAPADAAGECTARLTAVKNALAQATALVNAALSHASGSTETGATTPADTNTAPPRRSKLVRNDSGNTTSGGGASPRTDDQPSSSSSVRSSSRMRKSKKSKKRERKERHARRVDEHARRILSSGKGVFEIVIRGSKVEAGTLTLRSRSLKIKLAKGNSVRANSAVTLYNEPYFNAASGAHIRVLFHQTNERLILVNFDGQRMIQIEAESRLERDVMHKAIQLFIEGPEAAAHAGPS